MGQLVNIMAYSMGHPVWNTNCHGIHHGTYHGVHHGIPNGVHHGIPHVSIFPMEIDMRYIMRHVILESSWPMGYPMGYPTEAAMEYPMAALDPYKGRATPWKNLTGYTVGSSWSTPWSLLLYSTRTHMILSTKFHNSRE